MLWLPSSRVGVLEVEESHGWVREAGEHGKERQERAQEEVRSEGEEEAKRAANGHKNG